MGANHEEQDSEGAEYQGRQERDQKVIPVKGNQYESGGPLASQQDTEACKRQLPWRFSFGRWRVS